MHAPSNQVQRPNDVVALLAEVQSLGSAEANYGEVTIHRASDEIGTFDAEAIKKIAAHCNATQVVSVLYEGGMWARRDLFFLDQNGTLKEAVTRMSSIATGNTLEVLAERDVAFQRVIQGLAANVS